jgi:anaerobic selenocysteine-containing dehydrogenase
MTRKRVTSDFFAAHTVTDLMRWSDFALEDVGRLTEPMRYDLASDKYVPVAWDEDFALAGRHFQKLQSPDGAASTRRVV